jgi:hypothetical protein
VMAEASRLLAGHVADWRRGFEMEMQASCGG